MVKQKILAILQAVISFLLYVIMMVLGFQAVVWLLPVPAHLFFPVNALCAVVFGMGTMWMLRRVWDRKTIVSMGYQMRTPDGRPMWRELLLGCFCESGLPRLAERSAVPDRNPDGIPRLRAEAGLFEAAGRNRTDSRMVRCLVGCRCHCPDSPAASENVQIGRDVCIGTLSSRRLTCRRYQSGALSLFFATGCSGVLAYYANDPAWRCQRDGLEDCHLGGAAYSDAAAVALGNRFAGVVVAVGRVSGAPCGVVILRRAAHSLRRT